MGNFQFNISENKPQYRKNKIIQMVLFIIMAELLLFPFPGFAEKNENKKLIEAQIANISNKISILIPETIANVKTIEIAEDATNERTVAYSRRYTMTAYNSEEAQCDASPCITANGFNVCEHGIEDTVAANFLPFGTEIRIPELFGDKILIVRDRMNARYTERVDVWLLHKDNAIDFGVKYPLIEVLK